MIAFCTRRHTPPRLRKLPGGICAARSFPFDADRKLFQNSVERFSQADERHPFPLSRPHNRERNSRDVGHQNAELGTFNQAVSQQ